VKKRKTVKKAVKVAKKRQEVVKPAVKQAPKPVKAPKVCAPCGDPKTLCARGGCVHPRSIHITGECHQMGCVCPAFLEI